MKNINIKLAKELLEEAYKLNEGPWREHSYNVAEAARRIASECVDLDSEKAYIMGLLHDIGRRYGFSHLKHTIDGYNFLMNEGYYDIARICLTHSFPIKPLESYSGNNDCSNEESKLIKDYLYKTEYDDYDKLIQLCDALALNNGFCCVEKRLVDVALRNGFNEHTINKWKGYLELKDYFSNKINKSIYELFDLIN